jgi:hypothetical protein
MTEKEAIIILIQHNDWRRGNEDLPMTNPKLLGIAIDVIIEAWKDRNLPVDTDEVARNQNEINQK